MLCLSPGAPGVFFLIFHLSSRERFRILNFFIQGRKAWRNLTCSNFPIFIFFDLWKNWLKNSEWKNISDVSCDVAGLCTVQIIVPHSRHYGAVHNENPFLVYFEIQKEGKITRSFEETFEVSEILLNGFCSIDDRGIAAK